MPRRPVLAAAVFAIVLLVAAPSHGQDESPLTDADRRAFAWFDGIGLPSPKGKPFVRVTQTDKTPDANAPPEARSWATEGFLLIEDVASWTLLRTDRWTTTIRRDDERVAATIETLDLAVVAASELERLRRPDAGRGPQQWPFLRGSTHLGEQAEALSLARSCAERRLERAAKDLLDAARGLPVLRDGERVEGPIEETAAVELADSVLWQFTLDCDDASIPRTQLLERLRRWRKSFPKSEHAAKADADLRVLETMVAEDAAHAAVPDADLAKMTPDARARELIFRLRDQPGGQGMQPGSPSVFWQWPEVTDTPAHLLVAMGRDAVPALIDALVDDRFTRCVGFWRDFCFSHYVVRVGDAAREILERSVRLHVWSGKYTAASMVKDGEQADVQRRYREWWTEVSEFLPPFRALLAERDPAKRRDLARTFPDRGPGPVSGAPDTAIWGTGQFLDAFPDEDAANAKAALRALVADAPAPRTRTLAAWTLLDLGERGVVADVAALWKSLDDSVRADPVQGGAVASFLASCGDAAAIRALADGLDARPAAVRELAVLAFQEHALGAVRGLAGGVDGGIPVDWLVSGAAADAGEDLVVARLGDMEEDPLGRIPRQLPICDMVKEYDCGRRIADLAVRVLSRRIPGDYFLRSSPVRSAKEWEAARVEFVAKSKERAAAR